MGIGRKASAISGGALALALGGGLPVLGATPAHALDCTGGGGLVSGVTGTLCSVVGGVTGTVNRVTDTVDAATGGATAPVTNAVNDTVGAVTGAATTTVDNVGHAVDDTVDSTLKDVDTTLKKVDSTLKNTVGKTVDGTVGDNAGKTVGDNVGNTVDGIGRAVDHVGQAIDHAGQTIGRVTPTASPAVQAAEGLTRAVRDTCLPLLTGACAADEDQPPRGGGRPAPAPPKAGTLPLEPDHPWFVPVGDRTEVVGKRVDPDNDAVIPLLWPGQKVPEMAFWPRGKVVRPADRPHDAVGTALTAVLLLSALLATRVVSTRRARAEQRESIPFEGGVRLPSRSGRHRLA